MQLSAYCCPASQWPACGKNTRTTTNCCESLMLPIVNGVNPDRKQRLVQSDLGGFRRKLLPRADSAQTIGGRGTEMDTSTPRSETLPHPSFAPPRRHPPEHQQRQPFLSPRPRTASQTHRRPAFRIDRWAVMPAHLALRKADGLLFGRPLGHSSFHPRRQDTRPVPCIVPRDAKPFGPDPGELKAVIGRLATLSPCRVILSPKLVAAGQPCGNRFDRFSQVA